jgi:RHS repeat-associated core domain
MAQSADQNYVLTRTYLNKESSSYIDQIQYIDGLGRNVELVQKAITPSGKDLIKLVEYDGVGREYRQWLPTPATGSYGTYIDPATFKSSSISFYANDANPYSETILENSPLSRVKGQRQPGAVWNAHPTGVTYQTNSSEVIYFYVNGSNQLQRDGNYPANTLYKTVITDEDNKTTTEFKNKLGQVVMKRSSTNVDTYYVYNDMEQLCYVLPPSFVDGVGGSTLFPDEDVLLKQFAYLYRYDERGNNTLKRMPGCESIYMVYDVADRLILSQDGNQRNKSQWTVTKYDVLGRTIFTGTTNAIPNATTLDNLILGYKDKLIIENYNNGSGYTCTNFCDAAPLTISYYDSYDFSTFVTNGSSFNWGTPPTGFDGQYLDSNGQPNAKGLLTGTAVYHLNDPTKYETTAFYYDDRGRTVQTRASNHLGGYDITYNAFYFSGKPAKTYKTHGINGASDTYNELYAYTYDNAERLKTTTYQLNGGNSVVLASTNYDELGRVSTKSRHNGVDPQSYVYNIRNWPTKIASGTFEENLYYNSNLPSGVTANYNGNIAYSNWTYNGVNKGYAYVYDDLNRLTSANFKQGSSSQGNDSFNESFTYDKMGNILTLQRKKDNVLIDDLTLHYRNGEKSNQLEWITDARGTQALSNTKEYQDISKATSGEFAYDTNGNMTKDLDRNIVAIQYNILNLPDVIQFKNGNQIKNTYNASGQKLGTEYFTQVTNITPLADGQIINQSYNPGTVDQNGTAYIGNMEYNTLHGNLSLTAINRIYNDEGYVENPGNPQYYYYRKDHLDDNREVWLANTGETVQRTQYYPSGLPWAYNSGDNPGKQQRKYNSKEFVEMHGYDTYDIVWRQYYPAIMRFQTPDPFAEKYYNLSPYTMCADNMVRYTDPDGRFIPLIIAAVVEAPEIYLLGAAVIASVTASIHHYQSQHQASSYSYDSNNQQSSNSNNTQAKKNSQTNGSQTTSSNYSHLPDPKNTGDGKKTTRSQRQKILEENKRQNNGELKSDGDGRKLDPPSKNMKGQKANMNQAEVDHINPKSKGGSNSNSNLRVISKEENLVKGNR